MPAAQNLKTFKLNTGAEIPAIGLGTWRSPDNEGYQSVIDALEAGYRHIDTARIYLNEEVVGKAINDFIKKSGVPRSEIFVTTKLWNTDVQNPEAALKKSLERLQLDYVDLYLLHWPVVFVDNGELLPAGADGKIQLVSEDKWTFIDTYKATQKLVGTGLTKAIGVCNFSIVKLEKLLADKDVTVVPAANQVELHPYLPQHDLVKYCQSKSIVVEAYSPLGSEGAPLLKDETLIKLGEKYGVSPATIAISWAVARDTVVLPKSVKKARIVSNQETVDLSKEDVAVIDKIYETQGKRYVNPTWSDDIFDEKASKVSHTL